LLCEVVLFALDGNLVELRAGFIVESRHGLFAVHVFIGSQFLHFLVLHHQFYFLLHPLRLLLLFYLSMICLHSGYFIYQDRKTLKLCQIYGIVFIAIDEGFESLGQSQLMFDVIKCYKIIALYFYTFYHIFISVFAHKS
jgi:hypothetical protein